MRDFLEYIFRMDVIFKFLIIINTFCVFGLTWWCLLGNIPSPVQIKAALVCFMFVLVAIFVAYFKESV